MLCRLMCDSRPPIRDVQAPKCAASRVCDASCRCRKYGQHSVRRFCR